MASYVIGNVPTKYHYLFIVYSYFEIRESIQKHPLSIATKKKNKTHKANIS